MEKTFWTTEDFIRVFAGYGGVHIIDYYRDRRIAVLIRKFDDGSVRFLGVIDDPQLPMIPDYVSTPEVALKGAMKQVDSILAKEEEERKTNERTEG